MADILVRLRQLPTLPHSVWRSEASAICHDAIVEIELLREREAKRDRGEPVVAADPPRPGRARWYGRQE